MIQASFNSSCTALQYKTGTKFFHRAVPVLFVGEGTCTCILLDAVQRSPKFKCTSQPSVMTWIVTMTMYFLVYKYTGSLSLLLYCYMYVTE